MVDYPTLPVGAWVQVTLPYGTYVGRIVMVAPSVDHDCTYFVEMLDMDARFTTYVYPHELVPITPTSAEEARWLCAILTE